MNKKKGLLVLAVVLLCGVGIAFAALADTVTINGTASALAADFKLEFDTETAVTPTLNPADNTVMKLVAPTYSEDKKTATIKVTGLKHKNDSITVPLTIVNKGEVPAGINDVIKNAENNGDIELNTEGLAPNYQVDVAIDNNMIPAGGSAVVEVTVTLVKPFIDTTEAEKESPFTVTITGHAIEDPAA